MVVREQRTTECNRSTAGSKRTAAAEDGRAAGTHGAGRLLEELQQSCVLLV